MIVSELHLMDTNTVSYFVSGRSPAVERIYFELEAKQRIAISVITQAEILFGLEKKPEATRLRREYDIFFGTIEILPWDSSAARAYGRLRAQLSAAGKSLAQMDLLIAAHAIAMGAVLVSHDHVFRNVGGLKLADWATDIS